MYKDWIQGAIRIPIAPPAIWTLLCKVYFNKHERHLTIECVLNYRVSDPIRVHNVTGWVQFFFVFFLEDAHVLFWGHWYPCFGLLVMSPLGFKARVGSSLFVFYRGKCNVYCLRSTSGATHIDLLAACIVTSPVPTYCCRGEVVGIQTHALRISVSQTLYQWFSFELGVSFVYCLVLVERMYACIWFMSLYYLSHILYICTPAILLWSMDVRTRSLP